MSDLNETTQTPTTLTGIFDQWDAIIRRLDDPATPEWEAKLLWQRERDLCAAAAKIPARNHLDLSIKLVMDMSQITPETNLMRSAVNDARRVVASNQGDAQLIVLFRHWNAARNVVISNDVSEETSDLIGELVDGMADEAATVPANTPRGLAVKIMMAGDMEMGNRPIVESTKRDIYRLAGLGANYREA
ncbi:MAG: hypothetical protein Q4G22_07345 [Paracoccus sp. (in: a-proteobacteria)]|uniref:hypothetical protein n=1 Tax=Paracoccus sp. TaxID=267 RepID=UPI0026DFC4AB|nr:hypothetical protein [Paracoccus sp. (in: a-proteobacteria)]MDO5631637.1 hypothetical protein [Paracoccus sp. (in: a-proteobacteria)]